MRSFRALLLYYGVTGWELDSDGDGDGTTITVASADLDCSDTGESALDSDCDDDEASTYPDADEYCDGHDDDCDGDTDEDDAVDAPTWYADTDADMYGDPLDTDRACDQPSGYVADDTDCDDSDAFISPDAAELTADGVDQNCNGSETCYVDGDGDSYGTTSTVVSTDMDCSDAGESAVDTDIDDGESTAYPGAPEIAGDGIDQDGDGGDDCYEDSDGDGYGTTTTVVSSDLDCDDAGESTDSSDLDDSDGSTYPGAPEIAGDGIDQDGDGGDACYADSDGDGYGTTTTLTSADMDCSDTRESGLSTDCDDSDPSAYPGATEAWYDGTDQDCDGWSDYDQDGDSYDSDAYSGTDCDDLDGATSPSATETWYDGTDQDCDGWSDYDQNRDGYDSDAHGGTDCDDGEAGISPAASEICGDGLDNDCDGTASGCGWSGDINLAYADGEIFFSGYTGGSVSKAEGGGDVDGDGLDDFAVGIPYANSNGNEAGVAYVFLGPATGTLTHSDAFFSMVGEMDYDYMGGSLSLGGDLTGDGLADPVFGAMCNADCSAGKVYGYMGGASLVDFVTISESGAPNYFGKAIEHVPDIDGDGIDELVASAVGDPSRLDGEWYFFDSPVAAASSSASASGVITMGSRATDTTAGFDFEGDGNEDILFQSPESDTVWLFDATTIVSGSYGTSDATLSLTTGASEYLGDDAEPLGDVNEDGFDDILIGALSSDVDATNSGRAYLYYGPDATDISVFGGADADDNLGSSVASGDFNGDGFNDLIIGAYYRDGMSTQSGANFVFYGPITAASYDIADADAAFLGESPQNYSGTVASGGDLNDDGYDDLLISAPGRANEGSVYIVHGEAGM